MASVIEMGKYFVSKGPSDEKRESVTPLRLQLMLYYAQGLSLVLRQRPLFAELIEAGIHGPVVREIYQYFQHDQGDPISVEQDYAMVISEADRRFLDMVWNYLGKRSINELNQQASSEAPWKDARVGMKATDRGNQLINLDTLQETLTKDLERREVDLDAVQAYWQGVDDVIAGRTITLEEAKRNRMIREAV